MWYMFLYSVSLYPIIITYLGKVWYWDIHSF